MRSYEIFAVVAEELVKAKKKERKKLCVLV
jgi:hypothetical protein